MSYLVKRQNHNALNSKSHSKKKKLLLFYFNPARLNKLPSDPLMYITKNDELDIQFLNNDQRSCHLISNKYDQILVLSRPLDCKYCMKQISHRGCPGLCKVNPNLPECELNKILTSHKLFDVKLLIQPIYALVFAHRAHMCSFICNRVKENKFIKAPGFIFVDSFGDVVLKNSGLNSCCENRVICKSWAASSLKQAHLFTLKNIEINNDYIIIDVTPFLDHKIIVKEINSDFIFPNTTNVLLKRDIYEEKNLTPEQYLNSKKLFSNKNNKTKNLNQSNLCQSIGEGILIQQYLAHDLVIKFYIFRSRDMKNGIYWDLRPSELSERLLENDQNSICLCTNCSKSTNEDCFNTSFIEILEHYLYSKDKEKISYENTENYHEIFNKKKVPFHNLNNNCNKELTLRNIDESSTNINNNLSNITGNFCKYISYPHNINDSSKSLVNKKTPNTEDNNINQKILHLGNTIAELLDISVPLYGVDVAILKNSAVILDINLLPASKCLSPEVFWKNLYSSVSEF